MVVLKKTSAWHYLEIIVAAVLLIFLLLIVVGNFCNHCTSCGNACINNLRQIDAAANEFALEHGKTNGEAISFPTDLTPYIKLNSEGKIPSCPAGGSYSIRRVGDVPTCSLGTTVDPPHVMP